MDRKEQIKQAKRLIATGISKDLVEVLEKQFPELAESEDERIRKGLVKMISNIDGGHPFENYGIIKKEALAYLEKQKEQKPVASWTIQDARPGDILNSARVQATIIFKGFNPDGKHIDAYCALQKGFFIAQELPWDRDFEPATQFWKDALFDAMVRKGYLWDAENKSLNKAVQKPAEKQDYSGLNDLERAIHRGFLSAGVENVLVTIIKETAQECLAQMKPAEWSEEDESCKRDLLLILDCFYEERFKPSTLITQKRDEYAEKLRNWLKCIPVRISIKEQKDWSEGEIEKIITDYLVMRETYGGMLCRLRCLKPPYPWKPSDEQMELLNKVYHYLFADKYATADMQDGLGDFIDELKEL